MGENMILANEKQLSKILNISDRRVRELFKDYKSENGSYPLIKCVTEFINQTRSGDINLVTQKTLAEILGLSEKTVKELANRGVLEKNSNGQFDLKDNLKRYLTVTDERNKKKAVERELQQYKLEILQDKYHLDEDVKYVLTDILVKFKAKLQATAVKIDNEISEISEADRLDYLKNTLIDCLEELANYNPPSNRRKAKDV
ncbi:hypothetical protein HMPREF3221_01683 [Fusobacterium nucleatum]|uniref:Uncharacterized protein n=2 Tax=Fusobacterium nucleatum TaxID=851 RepID=A0A133NQR8_FUSNU|nr:hypothetical protein HMPREF3221_01683 [Fusobacterium nucleatum]